MELVLAMVLLQDLVALWFATLGSVSQSLRDWINLRDSDMGNGEKEKNKDLN